MWPRSACTFGMVASQVDPVRLSKRSTKICRFGWNTLMGVKLANAALPGNPIPPKTGKSL
jgi:hypothetical protein